MSEPIDPNNKYGIRGYNGLFLKICKLVYPDRMGCGAEKSCKYVPDDRVFSDIRSEEVKEQSKKPEGYAEANRPGWHALVYGGESYKDDFDWTEWRKIKRRIIRRDGNKCKRCGTNKYLTAHHVKPRSDGGETIDRNLITLCYKCHDIVEIELSEASI